MGIGNEQTEFSVISEYTQANKNNVGKTTQNTLDRAICSYVIVTLSTNETKFADR